MAINVMVSWSNKGTIRNSIISVLSKDFPLTAKTLYYRIKKQGNNVTYQAVHKSLKELIAEKVVKKESQKYSLNKEWISSVFTFMRRLKSRYSNKLKKVEDGCLIFESLWETDRFIINFLARQLTNRRRKEIICFHWNHLWIPLFIDKKEYQGIREFAKKAKIYQLCKGKTAIDKWCARFWSKYGIKVKTGIDCASRANMVIFKNTIMEVFYPPEINKKLDSIFEKSRGINNLDVNKLLERVFEKKVPVYIQINENKKLASQLREETTSYFSP